MISLSANELKKGGVTALDKAMKSDSEQQVVIDVRGKPKYMVLGIDEYNAYREYELDKAIAEAKLDYHAGKYDEVINFEALAEELKRI